MNKPFLYIAIFLVFNFEVFAQVNEVNKNVKKDKKNETSGSVDTNSNTSAKKNSSNNGSGLIYFVANIFIHTIGAAQVAALENKELYPERISLESFSTFGTELTGGTNYFKTRVRANWGIFGSDFTYSKLMDPTGDLNSIDWLVAVFRLPIRSFKIDYGIGFISLADLDKSYFKSSIGFDWRIPSAGLNVSSAYQWSERTSLGSRYKRNFIMRVDFSSYNYRKLHISPLVEYTYQNYFNETEFSLYSLGVVIRLF